MIKDEGVGEGEGTEGSEAHGQFTVAIDDVAANQEGKKSGDADLLVENQNTRCRISAPPGRKGAKKRDDHNSESGRIEQGAGRGAEEVLSQFRDDTDYGKYPPGRSRVKEKEEDERGDQSVFETKGGRGVDELADQCLDQEAGKKQESKITKLQKPGDGVSAAPRKCSPQGQKLEKNDQDIDWKKLDFHVTIIHGYYSFPNTMVVMSKKTALIWIFIVAGAVLWKFVWQSMKGENITAQSPLSGGTMMQKGVGGGMMEPGERTVRVQTRYQNPGGSDEVGFVVTVGGDSIITDAQTEVLAVNPTSKDRQEAFAAELPAALRGKKLSELTALDRVGGSSLTTDAFNAMFPQLKSQL